MTQPSTLLELKNIELLSNQRTILEHISFSLHSSEIISLVGPNGAGKTSLIKIILGLTKPTAGTITRAPNLKIGYMPQKFTVNPHLPLTVEDFLSLNQTHLNAQIIQPLGIDSFFKAALNECSGGELQRVLLARALLQKPQLLVLDEPTQGVDIHGQAQFYELVDNFRQQLDCAVLMVSHDLHIVMAKTDLVLCLNQHICCAGAPIEVSRDPQYIKLFGDADALGVYNHHHDHHHDFHGGTTGCQHDG